MKNSSWIDIANITHRSGLALLGWIGIVVISGLLVSINEQRSFKAKLLGESTALVRLASQRADQHDAHLTSLSAVATAGQDVRRDLFLDLAETILRFYPRIEAVDLVKLSDQNDTVSTNGQTASGVASVMVQAAQSSTGLLQLRANPTDLQSYLLVKRSPNSDAAKYAIALTINGTALLDADASFLTSDAIKYGLLLPKGGVIAGIKQAEVPDYSKTLGSASQPLTLSVWTSNSWSSVLPWQKILMTVLIVSFIYMVLLTALRQFLQTRQAEKKALLSAQETRLAHASRVNALGEMASGLAHELTQPLTAILSQAQAGKHIAKRGDVTALTPVLDDTIAQAKRASEILKRMRRWTNPTRGELKESSLIEAAKVVDALLQPQADQQMAKLVFDYGEGKDVTVRADSIELEQVIFNLVRNALDAVSSVKTPVVKVKVSKKPDGVILDVQDNGIGLPDDIKDRLFEPFVTSKQDGTGLGLALCQRLVDRMGADISVKEHLGSTVFSVQFPTRDDMMKAEPG